MYYRSFYSSTFLRTVDKCKVRETLHASLHPFSVFLSAQQCPASTPDDIYASISLASAVLWCGDQLPCEQGRVLVVGE